VIPYGRHFVDDDDIAAVTEVLRGDVLTQGPAIDRFECAVAEYTGARFAVAVSSCTAGLHIAMKAISIGLGDKVITSPISFVSSANAGAYEGAEVLFADIDASSVNICAEDVRKLMESDSKVSAIIPVHFGGLACELSAFADEAKQAGVRVIEDAAHSLGSLYSDGSKVGSCKYSDMTVFSFHPVKLIAAGEGGIITTNDEDLYRRLLRLRSHGINKDSDNPVNTEVALTSGEKNPWFYQMLELGYHYRMTDIQAALGMSQFKKIDNFLNRRKEIAALYYEKLEAVPNIDFAQPQKLICNAHHLFVVRIDFEAINKSRARVMKELREQGIVTQVHYIPIPLQPYYGWSLAKAVQKIPNAMEYYGQCLSLPIFYGLKEQEQLSVISKLKAIIK
jgi:UDP-4-amino-4,6-dideoxy-N-acetyl-beta-L-altrosamine transaminase